MSSTIVNGRIVNLQDYSVHDGCGIRTLIFMKGCPWCQNPESLNIDFEIKYVQHLCIECFKCKQVCDQEAILEDRNMRIDLERYNYCMRCVETCPSGALSQVGATSTVEDILKKILSYKPFYDTSKNGGITISGGGTDVSAWILLGAFKKVQGVW